MRYYPHLDYLKGYIWNHQFPIELRIPVDMWGWCYEELHTLQATANRPIWAADSTGPAFMFNGCIVRPLEAS